MRAPAQFSRREDIMGENLRLVSLAVMPYAIPIIFIAGWVSILNIISFIGGWHELARVYRASGSFSGKRFYFQSAGMRWATGYNGCLTVGSNLYGLYLSVFLPFRIGHPALLIPWEDISAKPQRTGWFPTVRLHLAKCPSIPLVISKRLASKLSRASGHQFAV
jgi:hypothetical protein